jgi:hypothetical protein
MIDFAKIGSRMQAYEWADGNGYKYVRQRIGFSIYRRARDGNVVEIGDDHCAVYRRGKEQKGDRLIGKRTYALVN